VSAVKYIARADGAVGIAQSVRDPKRIEVAVRYGRWMSDPHTEPRWASKVMSSSIPTLHASR